MKSIKQFLDWVKLHPFKAVGFTCIFSVISTFLAFRDDLLIPGVGIYSGLIGLFVLVMWIDLKKVVAILLGVCIIFQGAPPARAETRSTDSCGPIIIGIVVIVAGGVVIYKVVKFCQKKFGDTPAKGTNAPPDDQFTMPMSATADDDAAASYSASASDIYCWSEQWPADSDPAPEPDDTCDDTDPPATVALVGSMPYLPMFITEPVPTPSDVVAFEITGMVRSPQQPWESAVPAIVRTRMVPKNADGVTPLLDTQEFYARLATHGISYFEGGGGVAFYGKAGQPCAPENCPIQFVPVPGKLLPDVIISNGRPQHQVAFQRSTDLTNWVTVFRSWVPEGQEVRCEDISRRTKAFYRMKKL